MTHPSTAGFEGGCRSCVVAGCGLFLRHGDGANDDHSQGAYPLARPRPPLRSGARFLFPGLEAIHRNNIVVSCLFLLRIPTTTNTTNNSTTTAHQRHHHNDHDHQHHRSRSIFPLAVVGAALELRPVGVCCFANHYWCASGVWRCCPVALPDSDCRRRCA